MQEKGFVTSFRKKTVRVFSPEDPKKLVSMAKERVKILEETLPQFSARYFKGNILPTVRVYQGQEGARMVLHEILEEAKELRSFGSIDDIFAVIETDFRKFIAERIKRKIPLKVILKDTPLARERKRTASQELREVRLVPEGYNYSSITFLWNEKLAMFSLKEGLIALVIESHELSEIQKGMFGLVWDTLEK